MALTIPQVKRLLNEHMSPSFDRNTVEGLLDEIERLSKPNVGEQLRQWIWEQIESHGDDLVAVRPAFDLILNKIDEFRIPTTDETVLDAEAMKKAAFAVFAKANENNLGRDKIESLWPSQHYPHWDGLAEAAIRAYLDATGAGK